MTGPLLSLVSLPTARPDSASALLAWMETLAGVPWSWGGPAGDCCRFTGAGIGVQTGVDPMGQLGALYADEEGATALLDALGGLRAAVGTVLGPPADNPLFRHTGDVALLEAWEDGRTGTVHPARVGLIVEEYVALRAMPGVGLVRATRAAAVWRLPR